MVNVAGDSDIPFKKLYPDVHIQVNASNEACTKPFPNT